MPPVPGRASRRASSRVLVAGLAAGIAIVTLASACAVTGVAAVATTPVVPAPAVPAQTASAPRDSTRVSLFGDSLAFEARAAFADQLARRAQAAATITTFPTTALCDFWSAINKDLRQHRTDVLVLEFSGNSSKCLRDRAGTLPAIGSARWLAHYLDDLRAVLALARTTDTIVIWATAPPLSPVQFPSDYPRTLAAAVRQLAVSSNRLRVVDSGSAVAEGRHRYSRTLPCRSDERALCRDGRIVVRSDDGLHFDCHGSHDEFGSCAGYSAGGRRFGEAMADAATDAAVSLEPRSGAF